MSITVPSTDLPVEDILPRLLEELRQSNTVILQAPPGAGKTTTVPLWLLKETDKKIIMLEPRRLAARAAATRMASLLGEKVGQTVGYRIRLDTKISKETRIEVVTEGILTRMLQTDPELEEIGLLIFDEFHERNLQTDLGLALARQSQDILRDDLKLLIMSATLDADQLSRLLGAPTVTSEGRQHPVETRFLDRPVQGRIEASLAREVEALCDLEKGDLLVFLPGAGEISRTLSHLADYAKKKDIALYPLFGNLSQKEQDKALFPDPEGRRKIVCATDIAETSLTIEGIRIVVDSGLSRIPLFDPNSGMSRLETKKISRASADQRRGRAGRLGPGLCLRMWTAAQDRGLVPHSSPEISVADLSSLALDLAKWGVVDAEELDWLTPPPEGLLAQAKDLLTTLGALKGDGNLSALGEEIVRLPLHPRLATMIVKAREKNLVPLACDMAALLSERDILKNQSESKNADLLFRLEQLNKSRRGGEKRPEIRRVLRNSDDLRRRFKAGKEPQEIGEAGLLLAFAYPDRIGQLRKNSKTVYRLSGGRGASLDVGDKLSGAPFIVVADLDGKGRDAR
ncbi:MAG: ATP-dependent helicase HrpB, partial [Sneathiellales bacterium]|nr:ATP-dependent helicase HrpB [Sneathiellales bacterium]